jgi:hypothetical protein
VQVHRWVMSGCYEFCLITMGLLQQDLCFSPLASADFQNCTSVVAKLSFTDSKKVIL